MVLTVDDLEGLEVAVSRQPGLVLLKLFVPPRYYNAHLVFSKTGEPVGVISAEALQVLAAADGRTNARSLIRGSNGEPVDPVRVGHFESLLGAGLLRPGDQDHPLRQVEPDKGTTRHSGDSCDLFIRFFYDYFGRVFRRGSPLIDSNQHFMEQIHRYFPMTGRLTCLDAGCGSGFYAAALARLGHTVYACDISQARVDEATRQPHAPGEILPLCSPLEDIPLPDASCDFVMCNFVLEHVGDPFAPMAEFVRLLRPGGQLLISVPSLNLRDTVAAWLYGELPTLNFEHLRSYGLIPRTHPWCEPTLDTVKFLSDQGCPVQSVEGINIDLGLFEPWFSLVRSARAALGAAFSVSFPWNMLGQQTILLAKRCNS